MYSRIAKYNICNEELIRWSFKNALNRLSNRLNKAEVKISKLKDLQKKI